MTITLGGITISNNMYLSGIETSSMVVVEQVRTIEGLSVTRAKPNPGGRSLTLGTQNRSGANQGIWCMEIIEQIKDLEILALPVELNYRGDIYQVLITGTGDMTPLHQFEPEGPYKKFVGSVSLLEV